MAGGPGRSATDAGGNPAEAREADGGPAGPRRADRLIVGAAILLICLGFACVVPPVSRQEMIDHHVYRRTVAMMRGGAGYYPAMDRALREVYGPAEGVRAYRMPTLFLLWNRMPSERGVWYSYTTLVALGGLAMLGLAENPVLALVAVMYLLCNANLRTDGGWFSQYMAAELWAAPLAAASVTAYKRLGSGPAAALALLTTLVRETAAGLLLGGLIDARRTRRPLRPWLLALGAAGLLYLVHAYLVWPHLVPPGQGRETPLVQAGRGLLGSFRMTGFGLPAGVLVGPLLWVLAMTKVAQPGHPGRMAIPFLALPLTGLMVNRPYWGAMVVPLTLIWGGDAVIQAVTKRRRGGTRTRPSKAPDP